MGLVLLIVLVVLALFTVVFVGYIVSIYNGLVRLKHNIEKAWSNINVLLKQRTDELTKLIASVKGYMKHEKGVLTEVTKARTAFMNSKSVPAKAAADNVMTSALKSLFAVAENYPQLKANENFINFQNRVSDIENQIADRREFYNDSVNTYNIRIQQIPYVIVANMLSYKAKQLFQVDAKDTKDVKVEF